MSDYNIYPAVDDDFNFPPEVRQAMAASPEAAALYTTPDTVNSLIDVAVSPKLDKNEAAATYATPEQIPPAINEALSNNQSVIDAAATAVTADIAGRDLVESTDGRMPQWTTTEDRLMVLLDAARRETWLGVNDVDGGPTPWALTHLQRSLGVGVLPVPGYLLALADSERRMTDLAIRSSDGQLADFVVDRLRPRILDGYLPPAPPVPRAYADTRWVEGTETYPIRADSTRACGFGSSSMQGMDSRMAALFAGHGVTYYSGGKGAEQAQHIAARLGSVPALLTLAGPWSTVEVRRNRCLYPNAETGAITGWTGRGTAVATVSTEQAHSGTRAYKVVCPGTSNDGISLNATSIEASSSTATETLSAWVYAPAGTQLRIVAEEYTTANVYVAQRIVVAFTGTGVWQRASVTSAKLTAANVLRFYVSLAADTAATFYVDDAVVETSTIVRPSFDGSASPDPALTPSWTGTANASASVLTGAGSVPVSTPTMSVTSALRTYSGTLAGVPGSLSYDAASSGFLFTRTTPGQAVVVPAGTAFIPDAASHRDAIVVLWMGKNNLGSGAGADALVIGLTDATFDWLVPLAKRALVLGHFVDTNTAVGGLEHQQIIAVNAAHKARYGRLFVDVSAYLTGSQVWLDTGITPTPDDLAKQAQGIKPPSLSENDGHLNAAGYDAVVAHLITPRLAELGWNLGA